MEDNYEFELSEEQIRNAIKKYGKEYVKNVYRKLMSDNQLDQFFSDGLKRDPTKIDLGNGGYRYRKLRPRGEF